MVLLVGTTNAEEEFTVRKVMTANDLIMVMEIERSGETVVFGMVDGG